MTNQTNDQKTGKPIAMPPPGKKPNHVLPIILLFIIFSALIIVGGIWWYGNQKQLAKQNWKDALNSIAELKEREIFKWRQERTNDALIISKRDKIIDYIKDKEAYAKNKEAIIYWLELIIRMYDYENIFLLNNKGNIVLSINDNYLESLNKSTLQLFKKSLNQQEIIFGDFYYCPIHKKVHIDVFAPVISKSDHKEEVVGGIIFLIDPDKFLYPLIQSWPTPSPTAETLLVTKEGDAVLFLNKLRHSQEGPLGLKFPLTNKSLPATRAVEGWEGLVEGRDYRNVPVLAVTKAVPGTPWHLVAKIDTEEVYRPLYREARVIIAAVIALILLVGAVLAWNLTAQRKKHYEALYHLEEEKRVILKHFEYLVKYANDIILLLDQEGNVKEVNDRAVATYGYSREELLKLNIRDILDSQEAPSIFNSSQEHPAEHGVVYETVHRRRDGSIFPVEGSVNRINLGGKDYFQEIIRDITERKNAEKALQEREALLSEVGQIAKIGGWEVDTETLEVRLSPEIYRIFEMPLGIKPSLEEIIAFFHPDEREKLTAALKLAMEQGEPYDLEIRGITAKGKELWTHTICNPEIIAGKTVKLKGTFQDITAWKRAQAELRLKEKLLDSASDSIFLHDPEGHFLYVNEAAYKDRGYEKDELLVMEIAALIAPEFTDGRERLLKELMAKGELIFESAHRRKDGSLMPVEIHARTIDLDDGKLILSVTRDITERKEAEKAIQKREQKLQSIFLTAPVGIGMSIKQSIMELNDQMCHLTGYSRDELLGQSARVFYSSDQGYQEVRSELYRQIRETGHGTVETRWQRKDGSLFEVLLHASALVPGNLDAGITFTALDISERKLAAENLLKEKTLSDNIINSLPAIFYLFDKTGRFLRWNSNFEEITGYTGDEFSKLSPLDFFEGEGKTVIETAIQEVFLKGERTAEADLLLKDGSKIPYFFTGRLIDLDGAPCVTGMGVDLSARKRAEEELRIAAQKWRATFDAMRDAVCLVDREGRIVQCNQATANLVEKPFPEIIGRFLWEVVYGETAPIEGCPFTCMRRSRHRETLTWAKGNRWWHMMVDPILNEAGEVTGAVYIIVDITMRKLAQDKIRDLNILLKAIKDVNEALLRVKGEKELFQRTCDLLVNVPYIRFSWIGLVQPGSFEVNPVAWAGVEAGYLSTIKVKWDDSEFGQGPTGEGLRTGKPVVRGCIATDPAPNPWRQEALKRGYQSNITLPLIHEGEVIGILKAYSGVPNAFGDEEIDFFNQVAGDIAVGIKSLRLEQDLVQGLIKSQVMMIQTVEAIASMAEMRDPYTAGHQRGVTHLACALGNELGLEADRIEGIRVAGFLHDIGKIVVPAEILNKPGKLSEYEMNIIRIHPQAGYDILKKIDFPWPVAQIVLQHHERINGSGYPQGLAEQDILLEARILAVADVVEAMAAHRPYRPALGVDKALEEISRNDGILYDHEVVEACLLLFKEKGYKFDLMLW